MSITIRKPKTMPTLQQDFDKFDNSSTSDILKNYEKSIIMMTKNLESKDNTIQKMTEEFEENEIMFNDLLKENTRLKKELCETKSNINSLEERLKDLQLANETLEESEYESHLLLQPLHHKLNKLEQEKDELQLKYSQLLINNRYNTEMPKKYNKNSLKLRKKKKRNEKRLRFLINKSKKQKRINNHLYKENHTYKESIKRLHNEIIIMTNSITERDKLLRDLQAKLKEAIQLAENNIINKSKYTEQLKIIKDLEITILQLQEFVNDKITASHDVLNNKKDKTTLNKCIDLLKENDKISIKIVGDYSVSNLGPKLRANFGANFEIDCNVYINAPIQYILSSAQGIINKCQTNKSTILLVLIKHFSREDFKRYLYYIQKMTESVKDTKIRLVFSNIPYEEKSVDMGDNNIAIQKINSTLNCITLYGNNLNLFNISNVNTKNMRRDQYQNIIVYFIKAICQNYGYINKQHQDFMQNLTPLIDT